MEGSDGERIAIVEDAGNGVPPAGADGRVGLFNFGTQVQRVFTNRHASIPGSGYRIASGSGGPTGTGDTSDASAAGGINIHQRGPMGIGSVDGVTAWTWGPSTGSTSRSRA